MHWSKAISYFFLLLSKLSFPNNFSDVKDIYASDKI